VNPAAITTLIDTLRLGGTPDTALPSRWQVADTRGLLDLVDYEGAAIWLFRRLRAVGALDRIPPAIAAALRDRAFEDTARRMQIEDEARHALDVLDEAEIPVVAIKGIARCALANRYPYLDARATSDVDLMVPQARLSDADQALRHAGYDTAEVNCTVLAQHHHLPPLQRGPITIELHSSTSMYLPPERAWERASGSAEMVDLGGRPVRVPAATEIAWSAISHSIEDDAAGFRLKRFLEVAALAGEGAPIDWELIEHRVATSREHNPEIPEPERRDYLRAWLDAAMWFVTPECRPAACAEPRFDIPALLRWRASVLSRRGWGGARWRAHLLEEGARAVIGMGLQPSPSDASRSARLRRAAGNEASRAVFHAWKLLNA